MPPLPAFGAESWLDEESPAAQQRSFKGLFSPVLLALRRFARFATTTPGKLTAITTVLIAAILAAGIAVGIAANTRQSNLDDLVTQTEPLANDSQELFNALSVADSAITTGFLKKYSADGNTQETFDRAISDATSAIIRATSGIHHIESREMQLILTIQESLPRYIQLITNAQTNDRLLNPVGASYLAQASALMQHDMLPSAEELHTLTSRTLFEERDRQVSPLWFPISGMIAAVLMLLVAQVWLAAKTNRRINKGWAAATLLMIIATLWSSVSSLLVWYGGTQAVNSSVTPLEKITQIRISVQQARTQEALGLIQRNYNEKTQRDFSDRLQAIDQTLQDIRAEVDKPTHIDNARESLRQWDRSHATMVAHIRQGNYNEAIDAAMSGDGKSASFITLDTELQNMISTMRSDLQNVLVSGRVTAERTSLVVVIMTILAAIAVFIGVRPRLQEFL